jgi:predicted nucleic acid-binding protein
MSGNKLVADTNIIIYHLNGNKDIEALLENAVVFISAITYSELLASAKTTPAELKIIKQYLSLIQVVHTNEFICETAAEIKRYSGMKLPDAIIAATCFYLDIPLLSLDNGFDKVNELRIIKPSI